MKKNYSKDVEELNPACWLSPGSNLSLDLQERRGNAASRQREAHHVFPKGLVGDAYLHFLHGSKCKVISADVWYWLNICHLPDVTNHLLS